MQDPRQIPAAATEIQSQGSGAGIRIGESSAAGVLLPSPPPEEARSLRAMVRKIEILQFPTPAKADQVLRHAC